MFKTDATSDHSPDLSESDSLTVDVSPLGAVIALSAAIVLGVGFTVGSILWQVIPPVELPPPLSDHHQDAENLIYILVFAVLLPLGVVAGLRLAERVDDVALPGALSTIAALAVVGIGAVVCVSRVAVEYEWADGTSMIGVAAAVWCLAAATILRRATQRAWPALAVVTRHERRLWELASVLLVAVVLSVTDLGSVSRLVVGIGFLSIVAIAFAYDRLTVPRVSRRLGILLDLLVVGGLALAVPNLVVALSGEPLAGFKTAIMVFHQNFYLGPANQILGGDAMLVEVLSQYGVGSIYFLAGAFLVLPIGNGTLGLVEGGLSALMFAATFATLRIARVPRLLAAAAMAVSVLVLVYGLEYPLGGLLQHGAFRFGPPVGVVLGAVAAARWPGRAGLARGLVLATVGVSSIWALEAFVYTMTTLLGITLLELGLLDRAERKAAAIGTVRRAVGAVVVAHTVFAVATLAAKGTLPRWNWYATTLREFLAGEIGDITYDFTSFSPALPVAGLYVLSAVALSVVVVRRKDLFDRHHVLLVAIAGTTAWGIALFSYVVNRGLDHIIPYVCLPAVAVVVLWFTLIGQDEVGVPVGARRLALVSVLGLSTLLIAAEWSEIKLRYPQSALSYAMPGGESLSDALDRVLHPEPFKPLARPAEDLLEAHMPGEDRSIIITDADLSIEVLMRSGRASSVPLGDPWEDSFVPGGHLEPLGEFVDGLAVGDRLLIDVYARRSFDAYRADPDRDPFDLPPSEAASLVPLGLASLQEWVLHEIGLRFDLEVIESQPNGLEVVALSPLGSSG